MKANEILRGKLLSEDGKLTLMVLSLDPKVVRSNELGRVVGEVRSAMHDDLAGTALDLRALRRPGRCSSRFAMRSNATGCFTTRSALPAVA